jgi:ABC-type hemin transport system ATPase subunit
MDNNTFQTLASVQAGTISAYTDTLKTILVLAGAGITTLASVIGGVVSHRNSKITRDNTEITSAVNATFERHRTELDKKQKEIIIAANGCKEAIDQARHEFITESEKFKVGVMKLSDRMDQKLSGITSVQKAIDHRLEQVEAKADIDRNNFHHLLIKLAKGDKNE